jgi:hypothetical protein
VAHQPARAQSAPVNGLILGNVKVQKSQLIERKPSYRHGQLLLEKDFIEEQGFHAHARYRHARNLHGFGVVHGLEVARAGDLAVTVSAGFAVDRRGHEIELREPETLELHGLSPGAVPWVTIGYRTEHAEKGHEADNRLDCYAFLRIATGVEPEDVRLARVRLDGSGRLEHHGIDPTERDRLRTHIAPGSVTPEALDGQLRTDWVTMPFHPSTLPHDEDDFQPPFRVGASRAMALKEYNDKPNDNGAAGTMAVLLPPGVRHVHRLMVAGEANERRLTAKLVKGGFDPHRMRHLREEIVTIEIPASGPFYQEAEVPENHRSMHDRNRTLAVDIRSEGFSSISLVALHVSY